MALYTKCILAPAVPEDGIRISVMSRHTLNDGLTPNPDITDDLWGYHFKDLGPSPKLIGDYYKRGLPWEEFEPRYLEEIRKDQKATMVHFIACLAIVRDVTLLCIEETCERCHRRLLAEECLRVRGQVEIICR